MNEKNKYKIAIDTKIKVGGASKIYLRLRFNGLKHDYYFGIDWPIHLFDPQASNLLPRFTCDYEVEGKNIIIGDILSRASKVFTSAYFDKIELTIPTFLDRFKNFVSSTDNFFNYWHNKLENLNNKEIITNQTYRRHKSTRKQLIEFNKNLILPINKIDTQYIQSYDAHLRKRKKYAHNTVCGFHKDFKKYLSLAVEDKLIDINPYKYFSFNFKDGIRDALTALELKKLKEFFIKTKGGDKKEILRRFLFSCVTGIRISDSRQVSANMIRNNALILNEFKGSSRNQKTTKIPLGSFAQELIKGCDGLLFAVFSNKHINEQLKIIAAQAEIDKNLTFHCARDTFGTLFIEMGGDIKSLQMLMGHTNIKTTMIYLKMSDERRQNLMANFDTLLS